MQTTKWTENVLIIWITRASQLEAVSYQTHGAEYKTSITGEIA